VRREADIAAIDVHLVAAKDAAQRGGRIHRPAHAARAHRRLGLPAAEREQIRRTEPPAPPAPASFTDAEGTSQTLAAYAGKGLVVNLWATWCVPCVAEMPELATLARMVAPEGILVLPLSGDRGGAEVVQRFYTAHGIAGLPVLLDPKGTAARAWGARGLPTTLIIDRQGREQARVEGAIDWAGAAVVAEIRRLTA
jgi:thiol-disulfide isomerase/thioredoxin